MAPLLTYSADGKSIAAGLAKRWTVSADGRAILEPHGAALVACRLAGQLARS